MNSFDIIYAGFIKYLIIKFRTVKYLKTIPYIKRNNVFNIIDFNLAISIKKNAIHFSCCDLSNNSKAFLENYLTTVFFDVNVGVYNCDYSAINFDKISYVKL